MPNTPQLASGRFIDVQFLAEAGLLELKKTKDGREKTTPLVNYDKIMLEIPV